VVAPSVLVGILYKDRQKSLACCLDSIRQLTYPKDRIGIYFVDNDSGSESRDLVLDFCKRYDKDFGMLSIVKIDKNFQGKDLTGDKDTLIPLLCDLRNYVRHYFLDHSGYDYFLELDSDQMLPSNSIEKLLFWGKHIVAGLTLIRVPVLRIYNVYQFVPKKHALDVHNEKWLEYSEKVIQYKDKLLHGLVPVDVAGGIVMFSRKAVEITSPKEPHRTGEDTVHCLRAKQEELDIFCDTDLFCPHIDEAGKQHKLVRYEKVQNVPQWVKKIIKKRGF